MSELGIVEARLAALGLSLPSPAAPAGNYLGAVREGNLVFLSGHGPLDPEGKLISGKVGVDFSLEEGYQHARLVGLNLLASLKAEIGSLDKVRKVVKVLGIVNAPPDFARQPQVINGCSDLFVEIFGLEVGKHARSAIGVASLPGQMSVEIEAVFAIN
jgi:enamine deaminase RidA (YjgF/YER057c/UK114 family)